MKVMSVFQRILELFLQFFTSEDSLSLPSFSIPSTICSIDAVNISSSAVHSKSPGSDGWPPVVIKEVADSINLAIYLIFAKSLESGTVPSM